MGLLKRIVAMMLLALWLPVTHHCFLETLPGLQALGTCCAAPAGCETPPTCEGDSCDTIESGLFRSVTPEKIIDFSPVLLAETFRATVDFIKVPAFAAPPSPPPELSAGWHFAARAAAPARAPSGLA